MASRRDALKGLLALCLASLGFKVAKATTQTISPVRRYPLEWDADIPDGHIIASVIPREEMERRLGLGQRELAETRRAFEEQLRKTHIDGTWGISYTTYPDWHTDV